jgi:nucleotide-binding universal stress UspA family protein
MFTRIVVAADGYSGGADALCLAEELAAAEAEIILADALPEGLAATVATLDAYHAALAADACTVLAERRPEGGLAVRATTIADTTPERALRNFAASARADLVVAGARGAVRLLRDGEPLPCPLALAPWGFRDVTGPAPLAIVTYDGGERSWAAVQLALELAGADCPLLVVPRYAAAGSAAGTPSASGSCVLERMPSLP